jgi:predicted AAA+ superfamily ATPase
MHFFCRAIVPTGGSWLNVLQASHVVFRAQLHFRNFGKRLVKTPKLYFVDTGLADWLRGIHDPSILSVHPPRGALFENFVVAGILKHRDSQGNLRPLHFWRDANGRKVDPVRSGTRRRAAPARDRNQIRPRPSPPTSRAICRLGGPPWAAKRRAARW